MIADKLRAAILQAAISGQLTDQRPEDGTATDLLESIAAEKATLVKAGKLKKPKPLPPVTKEEQPFDIPDTWEWIRLGLAISLLSGRDLASTEYFDGDEGTPYITGASNFVNGEIRTTRRTLVPSTVASRGDLLVTVKGTIGELAFLQEEKAHIARQVMAVSSQWLYLPFVEALLAFSIDQLKAQARSMIPGIDRATILGLPVPLPPVAEQERIVAKLDELMALIDQLAKLERERDDLDRAFFTALEASILQAATQGHLTLQHPEDGTATDLLQHIAEEKAALVKAGKLKNPKPLPPVAEDERPFTIPDTWEWTRLGETVDLVNGRAYKQNELLTSGKWPVLRVGNLFTNKSWYYSDLDLNEEKYCNSGDLLYAWSASFGPFIWDGPKAIFHYHIWNVNYFQMSRGYMYYFFDWDKLNLSASTTGSTMQHVSMVNMRPRLIPVPPAAEQIRIAAKLDAVLPLVRELQDTSA